MNKQNAIIIAASIVLASVIIGYCLCCPRYQITQAGANAVILDTHSGQTWSKFFGNSGHTNWEKDKPSINK